MASFQIAIPIILDHEGGYQSNENDPGNYNSLHQLVGTKYGINAKVYEAWVGYPPGALAMQKITQAEAIEIYRARYWNDIKGDEIKNQEIANILLDGRVNHGRLGVIFIQRLLKVADDGVVGPFTLAAINKANPSSLFNAYKKVRRNFYHELATRKPHMKVFLKGWLRRIDSFIFSAAGAASGVGMAFLFGLGLWLWNRKSN